VSEVIDAGQTVADSWPNDTVTDAKAITEPLDRVLRTRGLYDELLALLRDGVASIDETIQGNPVPDIPYLSITSRGPICRATMASDRRLVIVLELFTIDRDQSQYRFLDPAPEDCLRVHVR